MIYGQYHHLYTGHFDQGMKIGKGITLTFDGEIHKQGIWEHIDTLLQEREVESFE